MDRDQVTLLFPSCVCDADPESGQGDTGQGTMALGKAGRSLSHAGVVCRQHDGKKHPPPTPLLSMICLCCSIKSKLSRAGAPPRFPPCPCFDLAGAGQVLTEPGRAGAVAASSLVLRSPLKVWFPKLGESSAPMLWGRVGGTQVVPTGMLFGTLLSQRQVAPGGMRWLSMMPPKISPIHSTGHPAKVQQQHLFPSLCGKDGFKPPSLSPHSWAVLGGNWSAQHPRLSRSRSLLTRVPCKTC